jgi:hypothetical protein
MEKVKKQKRRYELVDPIERKKNNRSRETFISGNSNTSIFEFLAEVGIALRRNIENKLKVELPSLKRVEEKKILDDTLSNKDEVKIEIEAIKKLLKEGDKLTLVSNMKECEIDDLIKTKILIEKLGNFDNPIAREIEKNLLDPNISSSQLKKLIEDKDVFKEEDIEVVSIVSKYLSEPNTPNNKIEDGITSGLVAKLQNALSGNENIDNGLKIERHRERRENRK